MRAQEDSGRFLRIKRANNNAQSMKSMVQTKSKARPRSVVVLAASASNGIGSEILATQGESTRSGIMAPSAQADKVSAAAKATFGFKADGTFSGASVAEEHALPHASDQ
jgi:hypothetical protein